MTDYPITPPPELVQQWIEETRSHDTIGSYPEDLDQRIATRAAQWGADQELEACCEWLIDWDTCEGERLASLLHEGRRPKPPSLKEQALRRLDYVTAFGDDKDIIRRAIEALPD